MQAAKQSPLFSDDVRGVHQELDPDSVRLLDLFRSARLATGAHPRSIDREVWQLRSLVREATLCGRRCGLHVLADDLQLAKSLLLEPSRPIARSTGLSRLVAYQRLIVFVSQTLGQDPSAALERLDSLLPAAQSTAWHVVGTAVAGHPGRQRRLGPVLDGADLERIVECAPKNGGPLVELRNEALVALACFSGLRAEEIVALRWEDLQRDLVPSGHYGLTARVRRNGASRRLLVLGPAAKALTALEERIALSEERTGAVFRVWGAAGRALGYRSVRAILCGACRCAGLPPAEHVELRAAFAWWLKAHGLSDHEAASVLGLERVRSLDRLLRRHRELHAQRTVRERVAR